MPHTNISSTSPDIEKPIQVTQQGAMPGWSRERADSKLSAWSKSQDMATVERELERTQKEIRRSGSLSLGPEYVLKRQQERARARDAASRLDRIGIRLDLGPLMITDRAPGPPSAAPKQAGEQRELVKLKAELGKMRTHQAELEYALVTSERKREEERKAHECERKVMVTTIRRLKAALEEGAEPRVGQGGMYEGGSRRIYADDVDYERVYRPAPRVSFEDDSGEYTPKRRPASTVVYRPTPPRAHQRVSSADIPRTGLKPLSRFPAAGASGGGGSGSSSHRRTSFS